MSVRATDIRRAPAKLWRKTKQSLWQAHGRIKDKFRHQGLHDDFARITKRIPVSATDRSMLLDFFEERYDAITKAKTVQGTVRLAYSSRRPDAGFYEPPPYGQLPGPGEMAGHQISVPFDLSPDSETMVDVMFFFLHAR